MPHKKIIIRRRRYADTADVCDALVERLLALGLKIDTESENCIDILDALDQVVFWKKGVLQLDTVTLNCAEAELVGVLDEGQVGADEDTPFCETVRDLHMLIQRLDPEHHCSVDDDLAQAKATSQRPHRKSKRGAK